MLYLVALVVCHWTFGQDFTKRDTLLGSNTEYRDFWDVKKYEIEIEPNYRDKSLKGRNKIKFCVTKDVVNPIFQVDLQKPMRYEQILADFAIESITTDGDFIFIQSKKSFKKDEVYYIDITFGGNPTIAHNAPWDGGWIFTEDKNGNPWISVANQGIGASVWLPIKELWSDEPDEGAVLSIITPKDLVGVGNGRLISKVENKNKNIFTWEVKNTINSYNIIPYIGKFAHFSDEYEGEKGNLSLDYWVLDYNLDKAKKQFHQVKLMLKSFEHWFGAYPFYEDGYKIVETPYLGMEHQSNIAYGNNYTNGYLGGDLSGTGVGLLWDFVIVHESGHEWFGNSITAAEKADMWIHEAFTNYSETLFTESVFGKEAANKYVIGLRRNILNDIPIIGKYKVRAMGSGDQYMKGSNFLHTIRQVINNDDKFRQILRGMNKDFYHKIVTTEQVEKYIIQKSGIDFSSVFDQYLRTIKVPLLKYQQKGNVLKFKWEHVVENFNMPVRLKSHDIMIYPSQKWKQIKLSNKKKVEVDENYYIDTQAVEN